MTYPVARPLRALVAGAVLALAASQPAWALGERQFVRFAPEKNAVVLAAEPPSKIRGGALLGGRGGPMDNFVGEVTKYVITKAPCQVILTAPPASDSPAPRSIEPAKVEQTD